MSSLELLRILERVQKGESSPEAALVEWELSASQLPGGTSAAQLDLDRAARCGYPEVVYCPGKTAAAVVEILGVLHAAGQDAFATRASPEQVQAVRERFPTAEHDSVARTIRLPWGPLPEPSGKVVVITAGTGDLPVAAEARETARWMGCETDLIVDVGVAGPHRLPAQKHRFQDADAIVVAAGMEGALPSVVGGHVRCPVIAVPTSIGYGASFGGLSALLGMLNSCAANVAVVNIDAGFKGGFLAGMIARNAARLRKR